LANAGISVRSISDLTGFPEIMDGRVKTLHPKLHAGLLAVRDDPGHLRAAEEHGVEFVDLVCVNLYPFERTAGRRGVSDAEVVENIDVGGPTMIRAFEKVLELPYGENPHQRAAYYAQIGTRTHVLSMVSQIQGKQLSFNNLLDLDSARLLLSEFQIPACVIVKHNNPCGVAVASTGLEAYQRAFACDPMSAYGGVICLNQKVDRELAQALVGQFVEVLFARGYN